jgi:hypothetical protein
MPTKNGFRLEDMDDILELICRSVGDAFQFSGQNSQSHFLNTIGLDGMVEFSLQD